MYIFQKVFCVCGGGGRGFIINYYDDIIYSAAV